MIKKLCCIVLLACNSLIHGKVILWDLGGVLVDADKIGIAREVGVGHFLGYMFFDFCSPDIRVKLFEVLNFLEKPQKGFKAEAGDGSVLPTIMCHWLDGRVIGKDIIKRARVLINDLDKIDYFESNREKNLIKKTIEVMFDPVVLARHTLPIKKAYQLATECMKAKNKDGSSKNENFIFSNFDQVAFDILYKTKRHLFANFKGLIISAQIGLIKPQDEIFTYFLEKYNLKPSDCILIDDQKVNTDAAEKLGFKGILVKNGDFKTVRKKLVQLGAL